MTKKSFLLTIIVLLSAGTLILYFHSPDIVKAVDFASHAMTSNTVPAPRVVTVSSHLIDFIDFDGWRAFDGLNGSDNRWVGTGSGVEWLRLDLGLYNSGLLQTYGVRSAGVDEPTRAPKNWTMQGSNNGTDWDTLDTVTNQTGWGADELREFTSDVQTTYYQYFRLNITANNGALTYTQIGELYLNGLQIALDFAPHTMTTSNTPSPYVVSQSTYYSSPNFYGYHAFDGTLGTVQYWIGTNYGVDWLQLDIGSGNTKILDKYTIKVNTIPEPNRAPKNWTMLGSNNGTDWDTLDTVTDQTGWGSGEGREFTTDIQATAYRYFRLNITANNGDANYTQVGELYLGETAETAAAPFYTKVRGGTKARGGVKFR